MPTLVYLDICCLKRPFDDQRPARVQLETAAVAALIERVEDGDVSLVRSPAHDLENERNPREDRRLAAALWLEGANMTVQLTDAAESRARHLAGLGFGTLDALHLAFAEEAGASFFATTDDQILDLGRRHRESLRVVIANPIHVVRVLAGEQA